MANFGEYTDPLLHIHHTMDIHPNDAHFAMHVHDRPELFCFVSGRAYYMVEGAEYSLEPGGLLVIQPLETHRVKIVGDRPYERYSLLFSPELLDVVDPERQLLKPFLDRPLGQRNYYSPSEFHGEAPLDLFRAMCDPVNSMAERRTAILIHLFPLLGTISRAFSKRRPTDAEEPQRNTAEEVVAYINRHLFDNLSLGALAGRFFLSPSQLGRLFRQATGSSVWEYITIKRLMAARSRIRCGMRAVDACQECGFGDYSSFYRAYIRHFKHSPKLDQPGQQRPSEMPND